MLLLNLYFYYPHTCYKVINTLLLKKLSGSAVMKIEIKAIEENKAAYVSVTGPYDQIPEILEEVVGYVTAENLQITEPPYGIYMNRPMEVSPEELQYEMGITFIGDANGEGRVKIKEIPAHQAISTVYKGPYGQAAQIYQAIIKYAGENGYNIVGPVKEIYMNNPMEVSEDELLTEVQFPVMKK